MRKREDIQALIGQILALVRADEARVDYWSRRELAARLGENVITQNLCTSEECVRLHVANGHRHGSAITNCLDVDSLRELVHRAESIAGSVPDDPEAMPVLGPQEYPEVPPRYYEEVSNLTPVDVAGQIADAIAPV
ncbi:MAG: hypothetical protein JW808_10625, partial [Victivallales bacterium]|nr:hypothetical protein [Victivallales bacterium]